MIFIFISLNIIKELLIQHIYFFFEFDQQVLLLFELVSLFVFQLVFHILFLELYQLVFLVHHNIFLLVYHKLCHILSQLVYHSGNQDSLIFFVYQLVFSDSLIPIFFVLSHMQLVQPLVQLVVLLEQVVLQVLIQLIVFFFSLMLILPLQLYLEQQSDQVLH